MGFFDAAIAVPLRTAMTYCLLPGCLRPQNSETAKHCQTCGSKLWLKERYRPLHLIGQGGFGRTFLAVDEDLPSKPHCVIKQFYYPSTSGPPRKAIELFQREAVRLDELGTHPQIPQLLAHCEQNRQLYLVQEYIDGPTLKQELQKQGPYTEGQIWQLLQDLLPVLEFIHSRQVIHRDIKPANMIRRSHDQKPVLLDFGIAKVITTPELERTGTLIGSPEYIAPEQSRGKVVPASDLYSLGATCIHLLTQVSPLEMFDIVENQWAWRQFLPAGRSISDRLGQVLDKLLQSALSQRYPSAEAVQADLSIPQTMKSAPAVHPTLQVTAPRQRAPATPISFALLRQALINGKWQDADQETWRILCQAVGKPTGITLQPEDIAALPCQVLRTVNWLWLHHSRDRFGFSRQVQIYQAVEQDYSQFCTQVGWPVHNAQPHYLQFQRTAPIGHLPSRQWAGGYAWWRHLETIASKLKECGIS